MASPPLRITRFTILVSEHAGRARSRRGLNALRTLGAVLDKRTWWTKWTTRPDVREKWLREMDRLLVEANCPPAHFDGDGFDHGNKYESDDEFGEFSSHHQGVGAQGGDGVEYYDRAAMDEHFAQVYRHHKPITRMTYVNALLPPTNEDEEDLTHTILLILAVIHDPQPCSLQVLQSHLSDEDHENVLCILLLHIQKMAFHLEATKRDVSAVLGMLVKHMEQKTILSRSTYTPDPIPQTWLSDDAVSIELRDKFCAEITALESLPDNHKDWHANTNDQVLDLVHPSLFCGVIGATPVATSSKGEDLVGSSASQHLKPVVFAPTCGVLEGPSGTKFQWLPSEFDVAEDGTSTVIRKYINNLHPETHANLYDSIADIFTRFVPLFGQVLSSLDESHARTMYKEAKERITAALTNELGEAPSTRLRRLLAPGFFEIDGPQFTLKGSRCQVIVKAEIVLTPDKPEYASGSWHVEGTDAERILATGLYYVACENVTESRLSFRTLVHEPEYEQSDYVGVGLTYGLQNEQPLVQSLGSVSAVKVRTGIRKLLAFFLVDPVNERIPSTALVPPQQ